MHILSFNQLSELFDSKKIDDKLIDNLVAGHIF